MQGDVGKRFLELHSRFKTIRFEAFGSMIHQSEFYTLACLISQERQEAKAGKTGVSMNTLAKKMTVSPAMVSKTVNSLEKMNIVTRVSDDSDRRGVKVCITEKGKVVWEHDKKIRYELMKCIFDKFGEEKTEQFLDLAEELAEIVEEETKNQTEKGKNL